MPKYYRVNLKDKENNIIYPNIHNNWTFDKDGNVNINSNITLGNSNFIKLTYNEDNRKLMLSQCNVNYIVPNGGWAMGIDYKTQSNATFGAIGCLGEKETIKYFYIGANYNNPFFKVDNLGNASIKGTFAVNGTALKTNGNFFLDGTASGILGTATKIIFSTGNMQNVHAVITANSAGEIAFLNSLDSNTFTQKMIAYKPQISSFMCQTNESFNLGTSSVRWGSLYARDGYFRSYVYSGDYAGFGVDRNYYFMLGGQDSYTWIDLRRHSDGAVVNNLLFYPDKLTTHKMQTWKSICIPKNGAAGYGLCNSDDKSIIRDHNNGNITVDATGGMLYLAYQNTTNVNFFDGKVNIDSSGNIGALSVNSYRWSRFGGANNGARWIKLGSFDMDRDADILNITVYSGDGYNAVPYQNTMIEIFIKNGWQSSGSAANAFGVTAITSHYVNDSVQVKVLCGNHYSGDVWIYLPWGYWNGYYEVKGNYNYWNHSGAASASEPTDGTAQQVQKFHDVYSMDSSVRNIFANTIGCWNSYYSNYINGTVMFCW